MAEYVHPEVLVSTDWVKEHLKDPKIKLAEIDVDTKAYEAGHIPGAVDFNWTTQLSDNVRRDIVTKAGFEKLMGNAGISPDDTVVVYGDNHNWFACFGFWIMKVYGHKNILVMNGGRQKWLNEDDKSLTVEKTKVTPVTYKVTSEHPEIRALLPEVIAASSDGKTNLVDVRSVDEYTGKVIAPPGMTETAQRGGHVPKAKNVPWSQAVAADGTYKSADELRDLYLKGQNVDPSKPTIAYCRIGERSSHTWFALKYLLGIENVKNYDGSWTEYGSVIGAPIEK